MSLFRLIARLLLTRGLTHSLAVLIIAVGSGLVLTGLAVRGAARTALSAQAERFPLVVGGRVGAVPLVLGTLTGLQDLGAAVELSVYQQLAADERVDEVVPLLGGHTVGSFAVVATSPSYLTPRERFPLAAGRSFGLEQSEVVVGRDVAEGLGVELGAQIPLEHRHGHVEGPPTSLLVVGVLARTGTDVDRTLYCAVETILRSHETSSQPVAEPGPETAVASAPASPERGSDPRANGSKTGPRLSALLVRPRDETALLALQEELLAQPELGIALSGQTLRRVADSLSTGGKLLDLVVSGVVLLTLLALLMSTYATSAAQAREVAVLRVLGARRWQLLGLTLLSTLAVVGAGLGAGLALAGWLAEGAEQVLRRQLGLAATVSVLNAETAAMVAMVGLLLLAVGLLPSLAAYRLEAAEALGRPAGSGHATRSYLRWSLRVLIPLGVLIWAQSAMSLHGSELPVAPLEPASAELFRLLARGDEPANAARLAERDAQRITIEGYMVSLGDPFVVQDFFLVGDNPNLPRCPFCYRSPTSRERIRVRTGGRSLELSPSLVRVTGTLQLRPEAADPYSLDLTDFEVVVSGR